MARIRTIKPTFFTSLPMAGVSVEARLTFIGLWTYVDDEGRAVYDPRLLKAALWPLDDVLAGDVHQYVLELVAIKVAILYVVEQRDYIAVRAWKEHQHINRPTPSAFPAPPECSMNTHGALTEGSRQEGKGKEGNEEGKGKESARDAISDLAELAGDLPPESSDALHALIRSSHNPPAMVAELRALLSGLNGANGRPVPPATLGLVLRDMHANGDPLRMGLLRGYLKRHATEANSPLAGQTAVDQFVRGGTAA